jgi:hypothetical protein
MASEREVTVRINVRPGKIDSIAQGMSMSGKIQAEKSRIQQMFEGLGRDVAKQQEKLGAKASLPGIGSKVLRGVAGQALGSLVGGELGGLLGAGIAGGPIGAVAAGIVTIGKSLIQMPFQQMAYQAKSAAASMNDLLGPLGSIGQKMGDKMRDLRNPLLQAIPIVDKVSEAFAQMEEGKKGQAEASLALARIARPGLAAQFDRAVREEQAVAGLREARNLPGQILQTRLHSDLGLTMQRRGLAGFDLTAGQQFLLRRGREMLGGGRVGDAALRAGLAQQLGGPLAGARGLGAGPPRYGNIEDYLRESNIRAYQETRGVNADPTQEIADNTREIADWVRRQDQDGGQERGMRGW